MKKRTTRTAWWLSAILAVALLGGVGVMLAHGVTVGRVAVQVRRTKHWVVGRETTGCFGVCVWDITQTTNLGFFALDVTKGYDFRWFYPSHSRRPAATPGPAGPPASSRSRTAQSWIVWRLTAPAGGGAPFTVP